MTTANNDVFILLLGWIEFWWEGIKIRWRGTEWTNFWLVGGLPHPVSRKILYKICQKVFIYNEEALRISHTSCAKVTVLLLQDFSTLCVTDIYGIYFHFIQQIYHIMNRFNQAQWWKKNLSREYLSLNIIKHTCSWRNKFVVI